MFYRIGNKYHYMKHENPYEEEVEVCEQCGIQCDGGYCDCCEIEDDERRHRGK